MIRFMVKENLFVIMEVCMKGNGKITKEMVMVFKLIMSKKSMKDIFCKIKKMEKAKNIIKTEKSMKEIGRIMFGKVKDQWNLKMGKFIKELGRMMQWMDLDK